MVREYVDRKRLAKLGFASSIDSLDAYKADCFLIIDSEIDRARKG